MARLLIQCVIFATCIWLLSSCTNWFLRILNTIINSAITSSTDNKDINAKCQETMYSLYHEKSIATASCSSHSRYNLPLSRECLSQTPDGPSSRTALWRFSWRARDENRSKFPLHSRSALRWSTKFGYCMIPRCLSSTVITRGSVIKPSLNLCEGWQSPEIRRKNRENSIPQLRISVRAIISSSHWPSIIASDFENFWSKVKRVRRRFLNLKRLVQQLIHGQKATKFCTLHTKARNITTGKRCLNKPLRYASWKLQWYFTINFFLWFIRAWKRFKIISDVSR